MMIWKERGSDVSYDCLSAFFNLCNFVSNNPFFSFMSNIIFLFKYESLSLFRVNVEVSSSSPMSASMQSVKQETIRAQSSQMSSVGSLENG